jgi:spore maturation protein CgeB
MGTYAADRQPKLGDLFADPAQRLPQKHFLLAGPQYPSSLVWSRNVRRIIHLEPEFHPAFYCSSRFTLNLTRSEMVQAGYSPSVRLFEAAGCGTPIISDSWRGLDTFFCPREEILLPNSTEDVARYLTEISDQEAKEIGWRAQARVLAEHTAEKRAIQFENFVSAANIVSQSLSFAEK